MNDKTCAVATDKRFTRDRKKNRMLIIVAFFPLAGDEAKGPNSQTNGLLPLRHVLHVAGC